MKRRILLVDDEVAVLLTMKAVLEISGFEVETAASAREGKSRLRLREYDMVITDMRMESDAAGHEVIQAARTASYRPAVALLTAFPDDESDWQDLGSEQLLLKPMHTRVLLQQIEKLFGSHAKWVATQKPQPGIAQAAPAANAGKKAVAKGITKKAGVKFPAKAVAAVRASAKKATKKVAKKAAKKSINKTVKR